ncbi:hypothetical protein HCN44_005787 [Aphidius gifuensis]|uniref:C2H2-type domain-containing protein n=1 Tax=Aphidius gifuensis TaxID=684658 RepID=A0A834XVQ1_APHGI|nr:hypothetical protein HCN44_005787 [Aphidius gifuensis]
MYMGDQMIGYTCTKCNERNRRRTGRFNRKAGRKPYACKNCPRRYTSKQTLIRHVKFACGDNKGIRCPVCVGALLSLLRSGINKGKHTKKSRSLGSNEGGRHIRSSDGNTSETTSGRREVVFPDSFEVLPQPMDVNYVGVPHEQQRKFRCGWYYPSEVGDEVFPCDACGRQYRRFICLQRHKRIECGKAATHACNLCHYKFKHKHSLMRHYNVHLANRGADSIRNSSFGRKTARNKSKIGSSKAKKIIAKACNLRTRPNQFAYCDKCNRKFRQQSTRDHHRKICGTIDKKLHCSFCDYLSDRLSNVKRHLNQTHHVIDSPESFIIRTK